MPDLHVVRVGGLIPQEPPSVIQRGLLRLEESSFERFLGIALTTLYMPSKMQA